MDTDDNGNKTHNHYAVGTARIARSPTESVIYPSIKQLVNVPVTRQYGVNITRMRFGLDKRLTLIDEKSPAVLKYRTPHFR